MDEWISSLLDDLSQHWPWWLSSMVKATVWLAAGVVLDCAMRRQSASLRHAVAVIIALGLPVIMVANLSPRPEAVGWRPLDPMWERLTVQMAAEDPRTEIIRSPAVADSESRETTDAVDRWSWEGAVVGLWMAGVLGGWVRVLCRMGARCGAGRQADPVRERTLVVMVERECARAGVTRMPILRLEACGVPRVAGLWRPTLVMPEAFFGWPTEKQVAIVRHEVAHLRRRDLGWLAVTEAALALVWMLPLWGSMRRRLARACEEACDDEVLRSGVAPVDYADYLASFLAVSHYSVNRWAVPAVRRSGWVARFKRIIALDVSRCRLHGWKITGLVLAASVAAVGGTVSIGCTGPKSQGSVVKSFPERYPEPLPRLRGDARALSIKLVVFELSAEERHASALGFPGGFPKVGGQVLPPEDGWQLFHIRRKGTDCLTAPTVTARPGQTASAEVVRVLRAPVEFSKDASGQHYVPVAYEDFKIGVMLKVKAWPGSAPGDIRLNLQAEINEFEGFEPANPDFPGIEKPVFYRRLIRHGRGFPEAQSADGTIECPNGSYIIIGARPDGQEVEDAVPILSEVPLLGRLFRARRKENFIRLAAVHVVVEEARDSGSTK